MTEQLLAKQQLKPFFEFMATALQDCKDLNTTAQMPPHKRGALADDAPWVLTIWWRLYTEIAKPWAVRGLAAEPPTDSAFDLPKGNPIKDIEKWLRHKQAAAERMVARLEKEKAAATYKRDRKLINFLLHGWNTQATRAAKALSKMERMYKGPDRPLDAIRRDAAKLKKRRATR